MTNINLREISGGDYEYYSDAAASAIEALPESCWAALQEACDELTGTIDVGVDCDVTATSDTIEGFDDARKNHWSECKNRVEHVFDGFNAVEYVAVQASKGQIRATIIVVDCGEVRAVLR